MAYTNFQHCTEEEYTNIIYSQDAKNKIKILFNNVELANADRYCEKLTRKERILPDDSSKRFSLDNFVSQEIELILHDVDSSVIKDQVSISIGTLVDENNDVYEYVPLGIFNIQDTPTTDKNKITVKLRDNRVKFDFNYNGKELIDAHDGSATKLQILQDICSKAGVQTTITSFAGDSDLIGTYDNAITATTYISYLAEQAGAIAKIDREGKLIFTYLTDSKDETITGSGTIDDSFNGGLIDFQVEGKAEQHNYSGKNYANINKDPDWKYGNTVWERSGSNVTVKNNGTNSYAFVEYYVDNLKPNTVYTVSMDAVANENGNIRLSVDYPRDTGGVTSVRTLNTSGKQAHLTGKFTTPNDTSNLCVMLYSVSGTYKANAETTYSNIQIEEGSSETSYEPYVGGMPTPNPYYPEEIKTVSGIGNLFDESQLLEATDWTKNGYGYYTGTFASLNAKFGVNTTGFKILNTFKEKTAYTISFNAYVSAGTAIVRFYYTDNTQLNISISATSTTKYTLTTDNSKTISRIIGSYSSGGTNILYIKDIQLVEGTQEKTNVPYGHWLPVKVSDKNLLNNTLVSGSGSGLTWTVNEDKSVTINGTNTSGATRFIRIAPNFTLPAGTYTLSNGNANVSNNTFIFYDDKGRFSRTNISTVTFTQNTEIAPYIKISAGATVNNETIYPMIEENSTATDYIEHQEQTTLIDLNKYDENNNIVGNYELCSIGDNKDLLTIKNGKAILTKRMGKYVVDENTLFGSATQQVGLFWIYKPFTFVSYRGISNFFVNIPDTRITANAYAFQYLNDGEFAFRWSTTPSNRDRVYFKYLDLGSDTNAFKNWAIENKLTLYYRQAEEDIILRGTYDINLYEGVNYISIEDELEPTMNITYSIEKTPKRIPLSIVEKYEIGEPYSIERIVYEDAIRKYQTSDDSEKQTLYINSANPYISSQLQIDNISARTKNFIIDSVNTGKILGNPALDSYDLIEVYDDYSQETTKPIIFRTLANNILTYNGVLISEYDTQIGKEERTENVTIVGEPAFQKWAKAQIDNVESNVSIQTGRVDSLEDGMKNVYTIEQVNELVQDAERGVTNTFTKAGGNNIFRNTGLWFAQNDSNNPYEFWSGNVSRVKEDKAYNKNALSLQNSTLSQEQSIPNGDYTVSFIYKKLINLANVIVRINGVEYTLDSTEDKEFEENIIVSSQNIKIEFISDTANSCEIYDLMVNAGTVKLAYSQNQNETTTDTVNISKGITITSSDLDVKFKADADGIRTLDSNNTELTKFTDVGMTTKEAIIQSKSQIVGTLWQEVEEQTWITRL